MALFIISQPVLLMEQVCLIDHEGNSDQLIMRGDWVLAARRLVPRVHSVCTLSQLQGT